MYLYTKRIKTHTILDGAFIHSFIHSFCAEKIFSVAFRNAVMCWVVACVRPRHAR